MSTELSAYGLLPQHAVAELDAVYLDLRATTLRLRSTSPIASCIALPRLPSRLTESIVALAVPFIFGEGATARPGDGRSDLSVSRPGVRTQNVAVKGTGTAAWITVTATDRAADCLVWVDYSPRMVNNGGAVCARLFSRPPTVWANRTRLTLQQALSRYPGRPQEFAIELGPPLRVRSAWPVHG